MYESYPIAKIKGTVTVSRKELKTTDTSFKFDVCWSLQSKWFKPISVNIKIILDQQFKRANFYNQRNQLEFNSTAELRERCRKEVLVEVKFSNAHIFKPIDIEMHYNVLNTVPDSDGEFFIFLSLIQLSG